MKVIKKGVSLLDTPFLILIICCFPIVLFVRSGINQFGLIPVSYTHLTLPTNREVEISVVAVSLKKKKNRLGMISKADSRYKRQTM